VFRWLPFITWHASDALGICGGAKIVRLGGPSDGNAAATGAQMTTMYRSPRDARRAISTIHVEEKYTTHVDEASLPPIRLSSINRSIN